MQERNLSLMIQGHEIWLERSKIENDDVELSLVGAATTSGMVVKAVGARSGYPFNGVVGDFEVRNSAGVIQSLTSVTADQGVHTITATLLAGAYTVALKAPSQMTTKGYESIAPISVTVS